MSPAGLIKLCQSFWHSCLELFVFPLLDFHDGFIYLIWIVQNNLQSKNKNKWSPLWPICLCHVGSFADCLLSLFLYVVVTKVATQFNDNDKIFEVYRQETKKSEQWTLLMTPIFSEMTWTALSGFQLKHVFFKKPRYS